MTLDFCKFFVSANGVNDVKTLNYYFVSGLNKKISDHLKNLNQHDLKKDDIIVHIMFKVDRTNEMWSYLILRKVNNKWKCIGIM